MRKYQKIEKTIAETGMFSEYLPPCFVLPTTALCNAPTENCDLIPPYCFTMSRFNGNDARRNIYIPEAGAYAVARNFIREHNILQDLIDFTDKYGTASFSPIVGVDDSIVRHEQAYDIAFDIPEIPSSYIENIAKKLIRASGAKQVLKLDIATCYQSFYMHMITAILLGADAAQEEYYKYEKDRKDPTLNPIYLTYANLDSALRKMNMNRTNGILIGPLYSRILVESLLSRIDIELANEGIKYSRYTDDYEVYLYKDESKKVISTFTRILKRYGFSLNHEKTVLEDFPYYVVENLSQLFQDNTQNDLSSYELMHLFNTFMNLEKSGTKGAIRYLLKSIEQKPINTSQKDLYKAYLLTIISNNERSLTKACSLLIQRKDELILSEEDVSVIRNMLKEHLSNEHDLEVIWLTYLLIMTAKLTEEDKQRIVESNNELAQLLLLTKELLSADNISTIKNKATSWLLLYELFVADTISETEFIDKLHLKNNIEMYRKLKQKNSHFCKFK